MKPLKTIFKILLIIIGVLLIIYFLGPKPKRIDFSNIHTDHYANEVGKAIGDKVILVSCSTGSTLGLYIEANYPGIVVAHIMLSPNIDLHDPKSFLLDKPWGLQFARFILGGKFYTWEAPPAAKQ